MAVALARSFLRHNAGNGIGFTLITDRPISDRPADLTAIDWVQVDGGNYGGGFSVKLHLDSLAPARRSLFIDSDSLCFGTLLPVFDIFAGHDVSVIGRRVSTGHWFGDVGEFCRTFGLTGYPRFNGGIYYLEPGRIADAVYRTAREIEGRYDEVGFRRLRGFANDELCMAIALELHGQEPVADTGTIMNTEYEANETFEIDVLNGHALLRQDPSAPGRDLFYELNEMRPAIVHFFNSNVSAHPYRTQILLLHLTHSKGWPIYAARVWAAIRSVMPWKLKSALRPYYHAVFSLRQKRQSGH